MKEIEKAKTKDSENLQNNMREGRERKRVKTLRYKEKIRDKKV